ncbi:hypothetical protein [Marinospirillum perlucidum]|uniref:hypothetical protein n=1 Tax=Marinospirillum perlucidum TaxID=1982602 RepID=UPI000DF1B31E|nr:hypothetical protein [Marinospirillum perlucidum]
MQRIQDFSKKFSLFFMLGVTGCSLLYSNFSWSEVPDFSLRISENCEIAEDDLSKEDAVNKYRAAQWFLDALRDAETDRDLLELIYEMSVYRDELLYTQGNKPDLESFLNFRQSYDLDQIDPNELRDLLFYEILALYTQAVDIADEPEGDGYLTIAVECVATQPGTLPGFPSLRQYVNENERYYNAPLELAELRLSLGMNTYVVIEYYDKKDSQVRIVNDGISALQSFELNINGRRVFNGDIEQGESEQINLSNRYLRGTLSSEEKIGLGTYSTELLGFDHFKN